MAISSVLHLHVCQLDQLRIDHLFGLLEHVNQITRFGGIVRGEECVRRPGVVAATGAPNSMNVILRRGREVKVDDKLYVVHIQTTRCDIGCN